MVYCYLRQLYMQRRVWKYEGEKPKTKLKIMEVKL